MSVAWYFATGSAPAFPTDYTSTTLTTDGSPGDHTTAVPATNVADTWALIDLGAEEPVDQIRFSIKQFGDGTWALAGSNNASSWTAIDSGSPTGGGFVDYNVGSYSLSYRYFRLHVFDAGFISG